MLLARRALVVVALVLGCASNGTRPTTSAPPPRATSAIEAATPASSTASASASTSPASTSPQTVGIADCDAYLLRYRACMSTRHDPREVDERARVMADAWRRSATSDAARDALAGGCRQAMDALAKVPGCGA
jgi:hypothetical protein